MSDVTKGPFRLAAGDRFVSKWGKQLITVEQWLGEGANGSVYLARLPDKPSHCALKIGNDAFALQSEINALQSVARGAPNLLFADDGEVRGRSFSFYAMSFVPGVPLHQASGTAPRHSALRIGERLLLRLTELHAGGWAFGDVKPGNVMVSASGDVRLIDYGGATPFGRAVKQFTELYDRGFWRAGGRKADTAYDLFAFAAVMLETYGDGGRFRAAAQTPRLRHRAALVRLASESGRLAPVSGVLVRMLRGEFADSSKALQAWRKAAVLPSAEPPPSVRKSWPAIWFAGALLCFAAALWRLSEL